MDRGLLLFPQPAAGDTDSVAHGGRVGRELAHQGPVPPEDMDERGVPPSFAGGHNYFRDPVAIHIGGRRIQPVEVGQAPEAILDPGGRPVEMHHGHLSLPRHTRACAHDDLRPAIPIEVRRRDVRPEAIRIPVSMFRILDKVTAIYFFLSLLCLLTQLGFSAMIR